jgi:hypothetical protein
LVILFGVFFGIADYGAVKNNLKKTLSGRSIIARKRVHIINYVQGATGQN